MVRGSTAQDRPNVFNPETPWKESVMGVNSTFATVWNKLNRLKDEINACINSIPSTGDITNISNNVVNNYIGGGVVVPTLIVTSLTPNRLVATNALKSLVSSDLFGWVAGTANQVNVVDDADGTITLSTPQDIAAASTPTFAGLTLTGFDGVLLGTAGVVGAITAIDGDVLIGDVTPTWARLGITVPGVNVRNVLGVDNGELRPSWKTALDGVAPTAITIGAAGAAGTSLVFSHRDHTHASPATWTATPHAILSLIHADTVAHAVVDGDIMIGTVTPSWEALAIAIPAANVRNCLGVDNGELRPSWKTTLDGTMPETIAIGGAGQAGTSLIYSHRDHNHPAPATWTATAHNLLSAIHGDTTVDACVIGDLVVGGAGPAWTKLADVAVGQVLTSGGVGVLPAWSASLGLGIAPSGSLHTATSNAANTIYFDTYDDGATYTSLRLRKSDTDTIGTVAQTDTTDFLGELLFYGVNNTGPAWSMGASIQAQQEGAATNYVPTNLIFQTYTGVSQNTNQFVMRYTGFSGFGTATPASLLELYSATASPVLTITGIGFDPQIQLVTDTPVTWTMGVDETDDHFVIDPSTNLGYASAALQIDDSNRHVGIGVAPETYRRLYVRQTAANAHAMGAIYGAMEYTGSGAQADAAFGIIGQTYTFGTSTNTGIIYGLYFGTLDWSTAGTQADLRGAHVRCGNYTGNGVITNNSVLYLEAYHRVSNVINSRDIYIATPVVVTGTVTNDWCIYSDHAAPSRLIGDLQIAADNKGVVFGGAQDGSIFYNGTDLIYNSQLVGAGNHIFTGAIQGIHNSSDGSGGATGSFTTVDGKTVTVKDGIVTAIV